MLGQGVLRLLQGCGFPSTGCKVQIQEAVRDSFDRLLQPSISGEVIREAKAKADFEAMLADYLTWQMRNGTLRADLSAHGWHIGKVKGNEPPLSELLGMNEQLRTLVAGSYMKTNINITCALA